jgi:hypothetical protein
MAMRRLGMDAALLDETDAEREARGWDSDRRRQGRDLEPLRGSGNLPEKIESVPEQNLSGEDDGFEPFRDHLREHTDMSEDEIEHACELARDHIPRRGANGRDRASR